MKFECYFPYNVNLSLYFYTKRMTEDSLPIVIKRISYNYTREGKIDAIVL